MKVTCDHCDRTARGSRDDLIDMGWCRVVIYSPMRRKFTACPDHAKDALRDTVAAIDAEMVRAGRRLKTEYANLEGNERYYLNPKDVLHDPARFGIVDGKPTRAGCRERPKSETTLGGF